MVRQGAGSSKGPRTLLRRTSFTPLLRSPSVLLGFAMPGEAPNSDAVAADVQPAGNVTDEAVGSIDPQLSSTVWDWFVIIPSTWQ